LPTYPTCADELAALQALVEAAQSLLTNFNAGGVTETLLESEALNLGSDATSYPGVTQKGAYQYLQDVQAAAYILTANGTDLDNKAADVDVYRKQATQSTGAVIFSIATAGGSPTIIPIGTLVSAEPADPTAPPIIFATTTTGTILTGQTQSNSVLVTAVTAGSLGNVIAGAINTVASGPGGTAVTNPYSTGGGADTEGDDSPNGGLRARALAAIPAASQCTASALVEAAVSYAGITAAYVLDNTADDGYTPELGRVQLYVDDGTGDLGNPANPNHAVIAQLQADLDSGLYRAAGTQVHVVGATLLPVAISLQFTFDTNYTLSTGDQIQVAVQLAVYNYVNALSLGRPVTIAEIVATVCGVGGVWNVAANSVLINGANADLYPGPTQTPRCENLSDVDTPGAGVPLP
jgi:uncharacterized phage protein gp47/JayE